MRKSAEATDLTIIPTFYEALFNDNIKGVSIDFTELALDNMVEGLSCVKDIPLIGTAVALLKTAKNIYTRFELKKQLVFIQRVQKGERDQAGIEKRIKAYENKEKWFYDEAELLLVYLSRQNKVEKALILAELYLDYINEKISSETLHDCLDILDQIFLSDLPHLLKINQEEADIDIENLGDNVMANLKMIDFDLVRCGRLSSMGLLHTINGFSFGSYIPGNFLITEIGRYFCTLVNRSKNEKR